VAGVMSWERGRDRAAGIALGFGTVTKLYPAVVVVAAAVDLWRHGERARVRRLVTAAVATVAACNLPLLLLAPAGWWFPVKFQSARPPTWTSLWVLLFGRPGETSRVAATTQAHIANVGSIAVFAVGMAMLARRQWSQRESAVRTAFLHTIVFVLANKVYSPQYDLWLVPWFVLLPITVEWWAMFCVADAAVFGVTFLVIKHALPDSVIVQYVLLGAMLARATVLVLCGVRSRGPTAPVPNRPRVPWLRTTVPELPPATTPT